VSRKNPEPSLWRRFTEALRKMFALSSKRYLCDSCKYDYGNVCKRPERPNAVQCPDYKHK
jgi:hypothetical protein